MSGEIQPAASSSSSNPTSTSTSNPTAAQESMSPSSNPPTAAQESTSPSSNPPETIPVTINVYDAFFLNPILNWFGFGFYRTAVEVQGMEFMFCLDLGKAAIIRGNSGAYANRLGLRLRWSEVVGHTACRDQHEVQEVVQVVGSLGYFSLRGVNTYDYKTRNTHHFAADLVSALINHDRYELPAWITHRASLERFIRMLQVGPHRNVVVV